MKRFITVLLFLSSVTALNAGVIFQEDFEGYSGTLGYIDATGILAGTQFSLTSGTVDLNGAAWYSVLCHSPASGTCVDTTGGGGHPGVITTTSAIALSAGTYVLSFDLAGWDDGTYQENTSVQVTLGSLLSQTFYRDGASNPYSTVEIGFTVPVDTTAYLSFADLGGSAGYAGAVLDNISIAESPEPGTLMLLAVGIAGLAIKFGRR
jgi:hypothetical protein